MQKVLDNSQWGGFMHEQRPDVQEPAAASHLLDSLPCAKPVLSASLVPSHTALLMALRCGVIIHLHCIEEELTSQRNPPDSTPFLLSKLRVMLV